jgi:GMP synthase (glutamine-hydrolysing)
MDCMAARTIIIVDCLDGALADYCYRRMAGYFEPEFSALRIAADRDAIPADAAAFARETGAAGMLIGGSQYSPLDPEPWLPALERFIADFTRTGLPVLGICFGLEIMAAALGGALARRPELTVTLREVRLLESNPLFGGLGPVTLQPVSHEVMVSAAPPGFRVIANSGDCPVQAMRHESLPVYGVQFHPEMDKDIKIYDPDWLGMPDSDFERSEGPAVMRNFFKIIEKTLQ